MLVVGVKEAENQAVSYRDRVDGDQGAMPLDEALARLVAERDSRREPPGRATSRRRRLSRKRGRIILIERGNAGSDRWDQSANTIRIMIKIRIMIRIRIMITIMIRIGTVFQRRGSDRVVASDERYFAHEQLDVYRAAIAFVAWLSPLLEGVVRVGAVKDQLNQASNLDPAQYR